MSRDVDESRTSGRPRDTSVAPALLDAARKLVLKHGYKDVSIQLIAAEAGVAKQTLYRRWPSKADLILDAFLESAGYSEDIKPGPVAKMLRVFLENLFVNLRRDGPAIRSLIASAQDDPGFLESFRERFAVPRAEVAAGILRHGISRGELPKNTDVDMLTTVLHGAFWYRLLLGLPLDAGYAAKLAAVVVKAA